MVNRCVNRDTADNQDYFLRFKKGDEAGLGYIYRNLYRNMFWRTIGLVKEDVSADSIVHEAFLRLWVFRQRIRDMQHVFDFLKGQVKAGIQSYYKMARNRFHRSLLRLDGIEDYQEFMCGVEPVYDPEEELNTLQVEEQGEEEKRQWQAIQDVLPSLPEKQQLFIKLCLKYAFSYDRIAWHMGGISDYEVARQVEQSLERLRQIIQDTKKLSRAGKTANIHFEGDLSEEQAEIMRLRYELQYSFSDIARKLGLSQAAVQKHFVHAHTHIKQSRNKCA